MVWPLLIGCLLVRAHSREQGLVTRFALAWGWVWEYLVLLLSPAENGDSSLVSELLLAAGTGVACWLFSRGRSRRGGRSGGVEWWLSGTLAFVVVGAAFGSSGWYLPIRTEAGTPGRSGTFTRFLETPLVAQSFSRADRVDSSRLPVIVARLFSPVCGADWANGISLFRRRFHSCSRSRRNRAIGQLGRHPQRPQAGSSGCVVSGGYALLNRLAASECADVPISFFILATLALVTLLDKEWPGESHAAFWRWQGFARGWPHGPRTRASCWWCWCCPFGL